MKKVDPCVGNMIQVTEKKGTGIRCAVIRDPQGDKSVSIMNDGVIWSTCDYELVKKAMEEFEEKLKEEADKGIIVREKVHD